MKDYFLILTAEKSYIVPRESMVRVLNKLTKGRRRNSFRSYSQLGMCKLVKPSDSEKTPDPPG